jgi:hypothetical protein
MPTNSDLPEITSVPKTCFLNRAGLIDLKRKEVGFAVVFFLSSPAESNAFSTSHNQAMLYRVSQLLRTSSTVDEVACLVLQLEVEPVSPLLRLRGLQASGLRAS